MYSPKISEELIPDLYRIKRDMKVPMTGLVNWILKEYIRRYKIEKGVNTLGGNADLRTTRSVSDGRYSADDGLDRKPERAA